MLRVERSPLGLLMFVLGAGVGAVIPYLPFSFTSTKLDRKLQELPSPGAR